MRGPLKSTNIIPMNCFQEWLNMGWIIWLFSSIITGWWGAVTMWVDYLIYVEHKYNVVWCGVVWCGQMCGLIYSTFVPMGWLLYFLFVYFIFWLINPQIVFKMFVITEIYALQQQTSDAATGDSHKESDEDARWRRSEGRTITKIIVSEWFCSSISLFVSDWLVRYWLVTCDIANTNSECMRSGKYVRIALLVPNCISHWLVLSPSPYTPTSDGGEATEHL